MYMLTAIMIPIVSKRVTTVPVGVSVIGGERHSMWNPLSHASQNKRLSCNEPHKILSYIHNTHCFKSLGLGGC